MRMVNVRALTGLTVVALLTAAGPAESWAAGRAQRPAYCTKLLRITQDWRTICTKASPVKCDGRSPADRRQVVVNRLEATAQAALAAGRGDVAKAVSLSANWVASGATMLSAIRARENNLEERTTAAGWKANRTIKADCGFAPYTEKPRR